MQYKFFEWGRFDVFCGNKFVRDFGKGQITSKSAFTILGCNIFPL